jgi:hypothetical protein
MRICFGYILVPALSILIAGCAGTTVITSHSSTLASVMSSQSVGQSEFTLPPATSNPTCLPPCFYNIVPGKTTLTDTFKLLRATSLQIGNQNDGALIWETQRPPREWNTKVVSVENSISFLQGRVSSIRIRPPQGITLQSVVLKYGDPEAVAVGNPGGESALFDTLLLYPTKGLAFIGTWLPQSDYRTEVYTPSRNFSG